MKILGFREVSNLYCNICIFEYLIVIIFFFLRVIIFFILEIKIYVVFWKMFLKNVLFRIIILVKVVNWVFKVVSVFVCLINYNLFKSVLILNYCGMYLRFKLFF